MSKSIQLSVFSANGTQSVDVSGYFTKVFGLWLSGTFGGGTVSIEGGDVDNVEPLQVLDPYTGAWAPLAMTAVGHYEFECCTERLDLVLAGATSPLIIPVLFVGPSR